MKKIYFTFLLVAGMLTFGSATAQITTPQPSPGVTIKQTVGLTDIEVAYSRPGMKERKIFGDLVPFDEIWRTGANKATSIKFDDKLIIGGKEIPAGHYSMFTIPGKSEWTIIINKNTELWGVDGYKAEDDVARFNVAPMKTNCAIESFSIDFSHFTSNSAHMVMTWENTAVHIPVKAFVDEKVEAQIKATIFDSKEEVSAGSYHAAASYYLEKNKDLKQALEWEAKAVAGRPEAFWYTHQLAKIHKAMGNKNEAIAAAKLSIEVAKKAESDFGYIKRNEDLIAEMK